MLGNHIRATLFLIPQATAMRGLVMMVLMSCNQLFAQTIEMNWARSINGVNQEVGKSVVADEYGNSYTCGYFTGTADLNPDSGVMNKSSNGLQDIFITKVDINGDYVWSKTFGGVGNDMVYSLAIDKNKNIYAIGFFHNTVDFDPGNGVYSISSTTTNSQDIFVSKLDSNGNFVWAKTIGGSGYYDSLNNYYDAVCTGYTIAVDSSGNVYTGGSFLGSIDFDPNIGIQIETSLSMPHIFIEKLDSNGNLNWVKTAGEDKKGDEVFSLCLDASANVYITGVYADTMDIDPGSGVYQLVSTAYTSVFVLKLNTSGDFVWGLSVSGNQPNDQASGYALATDSIGQLYLSGHFKGQMDADPSSGNSMLISNGNYDVYVIKFESNGQMIWSKSFGSMNADYCYAIKTDAYSNLYLTGSYKGSVDVDPGPNQSMLTSATAFASDLYVLKLSSSGSFIDALSLGGNGNDLANSLAIYSNEILMTGYFSGIINYGQSQQIISNGGVDAFILKLNQTEMLLPISLLEFNGIEVEAGNLLKWVCNSDDPSSFIELEHSEDGNQFSKLRGFECLANSDNNSTYNFLDTNSSGFKTYYRLKLVDANQQYQYSNVISLGNHQIENKVALYPNPCKGLCLLLSSFEIEDASIHVMNEQGQVVLIKRVQHTNKIYLDLSNQMNGWYRISILEKKNGIKKSIFSTSLKLIKQGD